VVVEADGKQYLWGFPYRSGYQPHRLLSVEPVGYHAWGGANDLLMFVLGAKSSLQYQKNNRASPEQKLVRVTENIGRTLRYVAKRNRFSFSQKKLSAKGKAIWWLSEYQPKANKVTALVPLPGAGEDYTWLDSQTAVTAVDGILHLWQYQRSATAVVEDWLPWVDLSSWCGSKITRLAADKHGQKLAFVCDE
jgi:hypothetical protein